MKFQKNFNWWSCVTVIDFVVLIKFPSNIFQDFNSVSLSFWFCTLFKLYLLLITFFKLPHSFVFVEIKSIGYLTSKCTHSVLHHLNYSDPPHRRGFIQENAMENAIGVHNFRILHHQAVSKPILQLQYFISIFKTKM